MKYKDMCKTSKEYKNKWHILILKMRCIFLMIHTSYSTIFKIISFSKVVEYLAKMNQHYQTHHSVSHGLSAFRFICKETVEATWGGNCILSPITTVSFLFCLSVIIFRVNDCCSKGRDGTELYIGRESSVRGSAFCVLCSVRGSAWRSLA